MLAALAAPPAPVTLALHGEGRRLAAEHGMPVYDPLIVAAAREAGCAVLWSEVLQDGQRFDGLRLANPFVRLAS